MLDHALLIGIGLVCLSMLLVLVRVLLGPSLPDRIVALDALYVNAIALIILLGIAESDPVHFESALLIALIGFASAFRVCVVAYGHDWPLHQQHDFCSRNRGSLRSTVDGPKSA